MSILRAVTCSVACGIALVVLPGCGGESRRAGANAQEAATDQSQTAAEEAPKVAEPETRTFAQEWTRISLKSFKLEREEDTVALTVEASTPSAGWKVEIRPLAQAEEIFAEYEVVGLPPKGASAAVPETKTVTYRGKISPEVEQVLVHGNGGALFPD